MTLLAVRDLEVRFATRHGAVRAVDGVSFELGEGETLGLVGESGCGKSSLAKAIMRLVAPSGGRILFDGQDVTRLRGRALRAMRPNVQMIFQDPYASLNPRKRVGAIVEAPLKVHRRGDVAERRAHILSLFARVGLGPDALDRFPHEFSGGQRQRIGIARALALKPKLIVCDEAVSALDVSIRAQVLNLLADLQRELNLSYLFISHDLTVVEAIADRVAVMYLGRIVEIADGESLWGQPRHPYTRALISAAPLPDPEAAKRKSRILLHGDLPSPANPPQGCRFHTRCPAVVARCRTEEPAMREVSPGHFAACHRSEDLDS
jgi:oligopeptide/dipeptide ABC transporter ATP-binding protein